MNYELAFLITAVLLYLVIAFVLWYIFANDPFGDLTNRKYILICIGCLFWPIAIIVSLINGWANNWD